MNLQEIKKELSKNSDKEKAQKLQRFFKTGKGEYGEEDIFLGVKVPLLREIAKKYKSISLEDIQKLLESKIHEYKLIGLLILDNKYKNSDYKKKEEIFKFYLKNTKNINNWDLVDISAPLILGDYLLNKKRDVLYNLVKSKDMWERRIGVLSCFTFIRNNKFKDIIKISETLLRDEQDLIHKAVGWMLRETGKRNKSILRDFLNKNRKRMPRTMLRYAIEKFPEKERKEYLKK